MICVPRKRLLMPGQGIALPKRQRGFFTMPGGMGGARPAGGGGGGDPHFANVVSLLHFDGSDGSTTFTDQIAGRTWTRTGANIAIRTAQSKFGGASLGSGAASGNYLTSDTPASDFTFGTGDFTIELWHRTPASLASFWFIIDFRSSTNDLKPCLFYNGAWIYYTGGAVRISGSTASTNTWYHIAVSRASGTTRLFVDGVQQGGNYTDGNSYVQCRAAINCAGDSLGSFGANAYWDDLRITKGVGRYTSTFTPPSAAFPNS